MEELLKMDISVWQFIWGIPVFFIGIYANSRINTYKVRAELKAKTRLQWIEEVREISADIIGMYYASIFIVKRNYDEYEEKTLEEFNPNIVEYLHNEQIKNLNKMSSESLGDFIKKTSLFKLYFSPYSKKKWYEFNKQLYIENKENKKIHEYVENLNNEILEVEDKFIYERKLYNPRDLESINIFRDEVSKYLKKEWDRAKKNK